MIARRCRLPMEILGAVRAEQHAVVVIVIMTVPAERVLDLDRWRVAENIGSAIGRRDERNGNWPWRRRDGRNWR